MFLWVYVHLKLSCWNSTTWEWLKYRLSFLKIDARLDSSTLLSPSKPHYLLSLLSVEEACWLSRWWKLFLHRTTSQPPGVLTSSFCRLTVAFGRSASPTTTSTRTAATSWKHAWWSEWPSGVGTTPPAAWTGATSARKRSAPARAPPCHTESPQGKPGEEVKQG